MSNTFTGSTSFDYTFQTYYPSVTTTNTYTLLPSPIVLTWPQIQQVNQAFVGVANKWNGYTERDRKIEEEKKRARQADQLDRAVRNLAYYYEAAVARYEANLADKRASALLKDLCTPEQWKEWMALKQITVINKTSKRTYRVTPNRRVMYLDALGIEANQYCIVTFGVPYLDVLISQMLLAKYDDTTLREIGIPNNPDPVHSGYIATHR